MIVTLAASTGLLAGCESSSGKKYYTDHGVDAGELVNGRAAIWVDPDGCQHWYIDDGMEGYMTPRLNRDGTPRCVGGSQGTIVSKDGTVIAVTD
jgi:hypothetical protein